MFDKLFGKKKTPAFQLPEPLHLTIDRSVSIEPMAWKFWPDDCLIDIASGDLNIIAQGQIDLGEGVWAHRFYPDEDSLMLQFRGGDGIHDTSIEEVNLWYFHDVQYPSSDQAWQDMADKIRAPGFTYAGKHFDRVWFDSSDQAEDPVSMWETIYDDRQGENRRKVYQTCMLYGRFLSDGEPEFLLVNMEEPEGGDRCITYMIGRHLGQHQLSI